MQLLRIPTGGRQTSWSFYKCARKLNQGLPETNSVSGQNAVLNPGSPDVKAQALTTRPHCLLFSFRCFPGKSLEVSRSFYGSTVDVAF